MHSLASILRVLILDTSLAVSPASRVRAPLPALLTQRACSLRLLEEIVRPLHRDRRSEAHQLQRRGSDERWLELSVIFQSDSENPFVDHYVLTRASGRAATLLTLRTRNRVSRTV